MLVGAKNCINILALEGGPCAINRHEVQPAIFITSIPTNSRAMVDEVHSVHLEDEVEATEAVAPIAPRGRGRTRGPRAAANPRPTAQRLDRLEDTVLNLSNMMTRFVAAMTNAQAAPAPAVARQLGERTNSVGNGVQAPDQVAQRPRNSELSRSIARGES